MVLQPKSIGAMALRLTVGSVIATAGTTRGQVRYPSAFAVDGAGNLCVADTGNNRVLMYTPHP